MLPGRAHFSVLRLRPQRLLWLGQRITHPFTVTVQPSGSEPVPVAGTYLQSALLPRWLGRLAMVLAALAMAFVALWFTIKPTVNSRAVAETLAANGAPVTAAPTSSATASAPATTSANPKPPSGGTSHKPPAVTLPAPVGYWKLDDGAGTVAADTTGANAAQGSNIAWCPSGDCATFNGSNSQFVTSRAVLDTSAGNSFTVSAWVRLAQIPANGAFATAVSQDSGQNSGFYLQYSGADKRWAFARINAPRALSTGGPQLNTWTHLVGVFDASDNQLRLYVDGQLEGTTTDSSPAAATGGLAIGRGQFGGQPTDWFPGSVKQVEVFNVALTTAQVHKL